MVDIFNNKILCNKCEKVMKPILIAKNGFNLRAVKCEKCGELIVHPADKQEYEDKKNLNKTWARLNKRRTTQLHDEKDHKDYAILGFKRSQPMKQTKSMRNEDIE